MPGRARILGCGHSGGTPQFGNDWGACDPGDPRNRRLRSSVAVEDGGRVLVIDASPDFRAQTLAAGIGRVDAVLVTHAHSDHIGGLDDLRAASWRAGAEIPVHSDPSTLEALRTRFGYAFGRGGGAPFLEARAVEPGPGRHDVAGFGCTVFEQEHGNVRSLGCRIGDFAYSTDVSALPPAAMEALRGVRTWVVGCLGRRPNPRHAHLARVLEWIAELRPERTVLSHMGPGLDYASLAAELPEGVVPAHDGMVLDDLVIKGRGSCT